MSIRLAILLCGKMKEYAGVDGSRSARRGLWVVIGDVFEQLKWGFRQEEVKWPCLIHFESHLLFFTCLLSHVAQTGRLPFHSEYGLFIAFTSLLFYMCTHCTLIFILCYWLYVCLCVTNYVLLFLSHCFALSWPGRSCKWELVLNWPTWLNKGEIKNK